MELLSWVYQDHPRIFSGNEKETNLVIFFLNDKNKHITVGPLRPNKYSDAIGRLKSKWI
jgi:hypothetical protein